MNILITAGPTREYIDDVRFISNPSSGRMGFCVASEAARRRHSVHLLTGPTCLDAPAGVEVERFEEVEELYGLVVKGLERADAVVMAAAVGDYRPARRIPGKHKKTGAFTLELVATRDVAASIAPLKGRRVFVGFAVETADEIANAKKKVEKKALDFIVLNSPESFGADAAAFTFVYPDGSAKPLGGVSKAFAASRILDEIERLFGGSQGA